MFALFIATVLSSETDRRLDPFQFNYCVWNLAGFDSSQSSSKVEDISAIIYNSLSTCDYIVLPGATDETAVNQILAQMESKNMEGFERLISNGTADHSVFSRLTVNDVKTLSNSVSYPIADSKCNFTSSGTYDFSGAFYGNVEFHDTVNTTTLFSVNFPSTEGAEGCAIREALASEICNAVNNNPACYDIFVGGSFGQPASDSENYKAILQSCGLEAGSHRNSEAKSNANNQLIEDVYVKGTAQEWEDIFEVVSETEKMFDEQSPITYPVALYIHQPLSHRWFIFEISYSVCILAVAIGFFTWLMFFSRIKPTEEGQYEQLPK